jgi:DNA polymerase-3 subunit epsilon/ATP-dependent DNA helicase DinG
VQASWSTLKEFFEVIGDAMHQLAVALTRLEQYNISDYDDLVNGTDAASRYLDEVSTQLDAFAAQPDPNAIYWLYVGQDADHLSINSAPLHVGPLIEKYLWHSKESVVMTSATLQANGSFNFIRGRLNAEEVPTVEVGSPFNYRESHLVLFPTTSPIPTSASVSSAVERGIIELSAALGGRVMALYQLYTVAPDRAGDCPSSRVGQHYDL